MAGNNSVTGFEIYNSEMWGCIRKYETTLDCVYKMLARLGGLGPPTCGLEAPSRGL